MLARNQDFFTSADLDATICGASFIAAASLTRKTSLGLIINGILLIPPLLVGRPPKLLLTIMSLVVGGLLAHLVGAESDKPMNIAAVLLAVISVMAKSAFIQPRHHDTPADNIIILSSLTAFSSYVFNKKDDPYALALTIIALYISVFATTYNFVTKHNQYNVARLPATPQVQPVPEPVLE